VNTIRAAVVAYFRRTGHPMTAWYATQVPDLEILRYAAKYWDDLGLPPGVRAARPRLSHVRM
jgi:hypothetical protein